MRVLTFGGESHALAARVGREREPALVPNAGQMPCSQRGPGRTSYERKFVVLGDGRQVVDFTCLILLSRVRDQGHFAPRVALLTS